jgi:bifunctional DNA-binding transcriptional regulator/antitoxin component of YhaV-PrlF toxin-antitoxin module
LTAVTVLSIHEPTDMKTHIKTNPLVSLGPAAFPKLYGSVKMGERGQVVVPQEARVELGLRAGDKLLALGGFTGVQTVVLIKEESFGTILAEVSRRMSVLERLLQTANPADTDRAEGRRKPVAHRVPGRNGRSRA